MLDRIPDARGAVRGLEVASNESFLSRLMEYRRGVRAGLSELSPLMLFLRMLARLSMWDTFFAPVCCLLRVSVSTDNCESRRVGGFFGVPPPPPASSPDTLRGAIVRRGEGGTSPESDDPPLPVRGLVNSDDASRLRAAVARGVPTPATLYRKCAVAGLAGNSRDVDVTGWTADAILRGAFEAVTDTLPLSIADAGAKRDPRRSGRIGVPIRRFVTPPPPRVSSILVSTRTYHAQPSTLSSLSLLLTRNVNVYHETHSIFMR